MLTSKQRAYLKSLAMKEQPVVHLGKASLTEENAQSVDEVLAKRELVKVAVLKNCDDDPREIAEALAKMTRSEVVQVIGKKIVLYREAKDMPKEKRIQLPPAKKAAKG